jgi:hypothetical protein
MFGTGCAGGPYSLACAAGLDEEVFPCTPEAQASESVLLVFRKGTQLFSIPGPKKSCVPFS